jgi:hypothetical protein
MLVGGIVERLEPVGGAHCARSMWLRFLSDPVFVFATNSCNIRCFQIMKVVSSVVEKNYFCLAPFNQNCWFRHWLALVSEAIALGV